jgi:6-phosphofructokinase
MMKPVTDRDSLKVQKTCDALNLQGLVVVGGAKEVMHISALASKLEDKNITIVGVLQSPNRNVHLQKYIPITLGFDSARGVLAEVAGNITMDAMSSGKIYHFIRCGGSSLTLEIALQVEPTMILLNEEVADSKRSLKDMRCSLCPRKLAFSEGPKIGIAIGHLHS